jgi:hypothetical protein
VAVSKYDVANGALGGGHTGGIVPVTASEAIAAGDPVASTADGRAAVADTAGDIVLGIAMTGCAGGADCEVLLNLPGAGKI